MKVGEKYESIKNSELFKETESARNTAIVGFSLFAIPQLTPMASILWMLAGIDGGRTWFRLRNQPTVARWMLAVYTVLFIALVWKFFDIVF